MNASIKTAAGIAAAAFWVATAAHAQLLISGNDEKQSWDDAGKGVLSAPGKDSVSIIDIKNRTSPRILVNLPIPNTITGPPTNVAISPDQRLALVANSLDVVQADGGSKPQPDDKTHVIDLTASPPAELETVTVGKQPSGLAFSRDGKLALVANRAENSVSVLTIDGKDVKVADTVALSAQGAPSEQVSSVAIAPNGKLALVTKFASHKVAVLEIDGQKVTYTKYDMAVGLWPYNLQITADGKLRVGGHNRKPRSSGGQIATVAIIHLEAKAPRG